MFNPTWLAGVLVVVMLFGGTYWKGRIDGKEAIEAKHAATLARIQKHYNEAAEQLEVAKSERRIVFETIEKRVDRIIEKPFYRDTTCLDDGGLRIVSDAARGSAEPDATVSPFSFP